MPKRAEPIGRKLPPYMFVIDGGRLRLMGRAVYLPKYCAGDVDFPPSVLKPTREEYLRRAVLKENVTRALPEALRPPAPAKAPEPPKAKAPEPPKAKGD